MTARENYIKKITEWSAENGGSEYLLIDKKIKFLSDYLFLDYEPSCGPFPDFQSRLASWIINLPKDTDQKLLFKLLPRIFYLGREEFNCLHRTAFNSAIKTWMFELNNCNFEKDDYNSVLDKGIKETWFCPVTDSFRINQFYHLNNVTSKHTFRPDWRSLRKFGDKSKILDYVRCNKVKYLVLLEDFVGSGSQSSPPVEFACEVFSSPEAEELDVKVLFVPMIICPKGMERMQGMLEKYSNLSLKTIIEIKSSEIINEDTATTDSSLLPYVEMIKRTFPQVKGLSTAGELKKIQEFGYQNTGGLVVMYTNTPNNSLPLIFVESDSWSPLFKRHFRD